MGQYGRLTNTTNPLGQVKAYEYDKMSRVTEVNDPAGNVTAYTYDALYRLTRKDIQTPAGVHAVTNYTYDAVGNLLSASNGESSVAFVYDALNRAVETRQSFAGKTYTISYAYDAVGNRTMMATPWGKYSYTYDVLNRVDSITNPQGIQINFKYDAAGRRIGKTVFAAARNTAPLAETAYSYDAAGQLLSITNKAGGKVVAFDNYTYDALGNRVSMEDQNGMHTYRYDASNRLIVARDLPLAPFRGEGFAYDKAGNRRHDSVAKNYKYDAANRLLENTVYTYTHDQLGNLTSRTEKASSATITYAYSPENQLSNVVTPDAKVEYKYDPLGRRIEKTVNASPMRYVYDNEDIIAVLDGSNNLAQTFTHGPGIDEPLIMTKADMGNYYYHADGLGSITALTDGKGQIVETYSYKSYGQPIIQDQKGAVFDKSVIGNPYFFTARELDSESGLYYYRTRYYDWRRGAFTQEDSEGFNGGDANMYAYTTNSPTIFKDPFGKDIWIEGPSGSEPAGHLSVSVGALGGVYRSFSFGVDQNIPGFYMGSTYEDVTPGGVIYKNYYMRSSPQQDAAAISYILKHQFSRPYRSLYICRTYGSNLFRELHEVGFGQPKNRPSMLWKSCPNNPPSDISPMQIALRIITLPVYLTDFLGKTK